jgi:cobalamin biosynthesis Co2+ chelatase CbiK
MEEMLICLPCLHMMANTVVIVAAVVGFPGFDPLMQYFRKNGQRDVS